MGVMQHHDAITGTEKQHVSDEYHRELHSSIIACEANTKSALNQLVHVENSTAKFDFQFNSCLNLNISICEVSENSEKFIVTVYNSMSHVTNEFARFPVGGSRYEVRDHNNDLFPSQLIAIPTSLKELHYRESQSSNELVFQATGVPAMGFKSYYITRLADVATTKRRLKRAAIESIGWEDFSLKFDEMGLLNEIIVDGVTSRLVQNFAYYKGSINNNAIFDNRSSGAYIFRPDPNEDEVIVGESVTITNIVNGDLVHEVHQKFNDWISQVVRLHKSERFVEFEWLVGPIPADDGIGREVVSRFVVDIENDGIFYTDSNGREMLQRKINSRPTFDVLIEEPVAGNYYPINTKIAIDDGNFRLAVLPDRAQGGTSINNGTIELMVRNDLSHVTC